MLGHQIKKQGLFHDSVSSFYAMNELHVTHVACHACCRVFVVKEAVQ